MNACLPIIRQRKVAETAKSAGGLSVSVPRLTFRTSSKVRRSKVKVTRLLNALTENQPYLRNGKAYELQTLVYRCSTMTRITDMRGDLKGQRSRSPGCSGWLFKLPLAMSMGTLWRPHYRPRSLFNVEGYQMFSRRCHSSSTSRV